MEETQLFRSLEVDPEIERNDSILQLCQTDKPMESNTYNLLCSNKRKNEETCH